MRKLYILTKIFLINIVGAALEMKLGGKQSKWAGPLLMGILFLAIIPSFGWMAWAVFSTLFQVFAQIDQLPLAISLGLNIGTIAIFVLTAISGPPLFYFAKDVEHLLPLPLKPQEIIGAKFIVALLFEYGIALVIMGAMYVALWPHVATGMLTINAIVTFFTLPIIPLVYSTILVMVLMRVTRLGRNPDRYALVVGLLALVLSMSFAIFANQPFMMDEQQLIALVMGNQVITDALRGVFINNVFAARALAGEGFILQLVNVGITIAGVVVFFVFAKMLYFRGVIGLSESGSPAKKMTRDDILNSSQRRSQFTSCLRKELRLLFRSPTAFMNCALTVLIIPVALIAPLFYSIVSAGAFEFSDFATAIDFDNPRFAALILALMCALGFFMSAMALIAGTSISREGRNLFVMKYIPVPYRTQLNAKAASGLVVILPGIMVLFIALQWVFSLPPLLFIAGVLLALPGAVSFNYFCLLIDLIKPKLDWDNEAVAVKQNMNAILLMFGGMLLSAGVGAMGWFLLQTPLLTFVVLGVITSLFAVTMYQFTLSVGNELMEQLP